MLWSPPQHKTSSLNRREHYPRRWWSFLAICLRSWCGFQSRCSGRLSCNPPKTSFDHIAVPCGQHPESALKPKEAKANGLGFTQRSPLNSGELTRSCPDQPINLLYLLKFKTQKYFSISLLSLRMKCLIPICTRFWPGASDSWRLHTLCALTFTGCQPVHKLLNTQSILQKKTAIVNE